MDFRWCYCWFDTVPILGQEATNCYGALCSTGDARKGNKNLKTLLGGDVDYGILLCRVCRYTILLVLWFEPNFSFGSMMWIPGSVVVEGDYDDRQMFRWDRER